MTQNQTRSHLDVLTKKNMLIFTGALAVLVLLGTIIFGWRVLAIAGVAIVVSILIEFLFAKIRKKKLDYSLCITPLVFALLMPPTIPLWIVAVGAGFGVFFGKSLFGGLGKNVFNPAIVGVLFVTISFLAQMTTMWIDPKTGLESVVTPIVVLKGSAPFNYGMVDLLIGMTPGAIGVVSRLAILVLGIVLIVLKVVDWRIPVFYVGTVFLLSLIGWLIDPTLIRDPIAALFVGSLLFGAFFVATDPVTAPMSPVGRMVYGVGLAVLTVLIRHFSAFPEGLIFAIIIMNAVAPLIDNWRETKEVVQKESLEEEVKA